MKINFKHHILILLAFASIIISAAVYWYVYGTVIKQAETYSKDLAENSLDSGKKVNEKEVAKMYADTILGRAQLANAVLQDDKIITFIESIESIEQNTSLDINISSISNDDLSSSAKGTFGHLKVHVDINGSWSDVMRSIILIENLPYSLSVDNIHLQFSKDIKKVQWKASLDIIVLTIK
jgi:hypothetical protein